MLRSSEQSNFLQSINLIERYQFPVEQYHPQTEVAPLTHSLASLREEATAVLTTRNDPNPSPLPHYPNTSSCRDNSGARD